MTTNPGHLKSIPAAKLYRRALAAPNAKFGWVELPDCPMEVFAQLMDLREQEHPEAAVPTFEYRARILNEAIYHSKKIANVQPPEWRAEFAWLLALSNTDGTFEADPRSVWAQAYAFARPDFTSDKVAQLLDEYERVGLLRRAQDTEGRLWGFWVGSDNFQPPPSKRNHYKKGPRDLFDDGPAPVKPLCTPGADKVNTKGTMRQGELDSDFGVGVDSESESDIELNCAANKSKSEQPQEQPQKQVREEEQNLTPKTDTVEPTPKTQRLRKVLPREEFESRREEKQCAAASASSASEQAFIAEQVDAGRRANGYEPCSDGIWRPVASRQEAGYTLKREDGIWSKP